MAKKKKEDEEPKIDFEDISKEIGDVDKKQHIDQLGPAITETFLKHAKYTDKNGVVRFKSKFNKNEAEDLANDFYDTFAYHSHKRVFNLNDKQFESLQKIKDADGTPYIDVITQYHYRLPGRKDFVKALAGEEENEISHANLQEMFKENVGHHTNLLLEGIISKHGLNKPEHRNVVEEAIKGIRDKYKLPDKPKLKKMDQQRLIQQYIKLSEIHYKEGVHKE